MKKTLSLTERVFVLLCFQISPWSVHYFSHTYWLLPHVAITVVSIIIELCQNTNRKIQMSSTLKSLGSVGLKCAPTRVEDQCTVDQL